MNLSHNQIRDALALAINSGRAPENRVWVRDVFSDYVVYEDSGPDAALVKRTYAILDDKVTLGEPETVQEVRSYVPVKFTADMAAGEEIAGFVTWSGKIFEVGDYPDKQFSLSEGEADAITIAGFEPVQFDLEHQSTVLDGKLGGLEKVWRVGKSLFGLTRVPKAVDALIGSDPRRVSLEFDPATKRIRKIALVKNPRIADAELVAAFSAKPRSGPAMNPITKAIKSLFGTLQSATPEDLAAAEGELQGKPGTEGPVTPSTFSADDRAELQRLRAELATLKSKQSVDGSARLRETAVKFADDLIAAKKAVPAEKDALVAAFEASANADAPSGVAFSDSGDLTEGAALKTFKAACNARPALILTEDKTGKFALAASGESDASTTPTIDTDAIYNARKEGSGK